MNPRAIHISDRGNIHPNIAPDAAPTTSEITAAASHGSPSLARSTRLNAPIPEPKNTPDANGTRSLNPMSSRS